MAFANICARGNGSGGLETPDGDGDDFLVRVYVGGFLRGGDARGWLAWVVKLNRKRMDAFVVGLFLSC